MVASSAPFQGLWLLTMLAVLVTGLTGCKDGVEGPRLQSPALEAVDLNLRVPRLDPGAGGRQGSVPVRAATTAVSAALEQDDAQRWAATHLPETPRSERLLPVP